MPAIIGPVQIIHVGGGIVEFGDALNVSPKNNSKSSSGQGAGNTGAFVVTNNGVNVNNVLDTNLIDQPTIGNN